jgi:hypothetical protein
MVNIKIIVCWDVTLSYLAFITGVFEESAAYFFRLESPTVNDHIDIVKDSGQG